MNVELPDGTVVQDIPDGISRADLATKLKANGMKVPDEWLGGKKVGVVESALRTAADAARPAVKLFDMAAAGMAGLFGDTKGQDEIFEGMQARQEGMREMYAPKEGEEFSTTGQVAGGALSIPQAILGQGVAPGINRATEVTERGGTMGDAAKAGAVSGVVNQVLQMLPVKLGGKAVEKIGGGVLTKLATGAATGAAVNVPAGMLGRAAENAALPEGDQFKDLQHAALDPKAVAIDAGMSAAFGALGARAEMKAKATATAKAAAEAPPPFPADKFKDMGDGDYRAPNGATVTKEAWEASSRKVRDGWMKEKPPEEKIPVGETKELGPEALADTSAIDKIKEAHPSGPVAEAAEAVRKTKMKRAEAAAAAEKARADAAELRQAAGLTEDADLKAEFTKRADKLDPPNKIPAGEVKEGQPEIPVKEEKIPAGEAKELPEVKSEAPTEPLPVGEAKELTRSGVEPVEVPPTGEAKELFTDPNRPDVGAPEKLPVGEVKEGQPEIPVDIPKSIPAGKASEVPPKVAVDPAVLRRREEAARAAAEDARAKGDKEKYLALTKKADDLYAQEQAASEQKPLPVGEAKELTRSGVTPVEKAESVPAGEAKELFVDPKRAKTEHQDLGLPTIDESFMRHQERAQERKAPPPDERGRRQTRAALEKGAADGTLDKDGVALTLWAMDKNPNIARGLRVEAHAEGGGRALGSYNNASRIVKLFSGNNKHTAMHEVLHHTEAMMPEKVQRGIRREWLRRLDAEMAKATPDVRKALGEAKAVIGGAKPDKLVKAFADGTLTKEKHYELTDPSEFWAVNGPRILSERYASRGSWRAQAKQWLKEMVEHVKGTVGVRSDSALLKALNEVLDPTKTTGVQRAENKMVVHAEMRGAREERRKTERNAADDVKYTAERAAARKEESLDLAPNAKRTLPEESKADVVERKFFDRFNRVLKMQKVEPPKSEAGDIYQADQLYSGRVQARGDKLEKTFIKPLGKALEAAKKVGLTVRDADDYLMALHAPERNRVIAERNPKIKDGGSGLTDQQAKEIVDGFTPEQRKHLDGIAKQVHEMNRQKLDALVEDGLIKPEVRDKLNAQYKNYVPLKTLDAEAEFTGVGRGYDMRGNDIKAAMGRADKASSPIAASVMDASRSILRGEKARVDRAIYEYAQNDKGAQDFITPYDPEKPPPQLMSRKFDKDGKVTDIVDSQKVQDLTMSLMVNGEQVRVFVPDQLLRDQLRKVATGNDPGPVLAAIGRGTGAVGRMLTEFNPAFTLPNAVKDAITVALRAGAHEGLSTAKVMAGIPVAWKTILQHKRGSDSADAKLYEEFVNTGGKTGAYGIQGVADTMRSLEKAGADLGYVEHKGGVGRKVKNVLGSVAHVVSGANEVLEYASRFAVYKEARAAGYTPAKAAAAAKEITVNFNRSGEYGRTMNSVLVFANAALQGLRNTVVYAKNPKVRRGMLGMVALGAAVQAYNEMVGGENEETAEPNINSQNDSAVDKSVVLLSPGSRKGIKIPLPPEYAGLYAIGRRVYRAFSQGDVKREAAGIAGAVLDATSPVRVPDADSGTMSVAKALVPTLASPFADILTNQNYFGQPIVPKIRDEKAPPPYFTQSRAGTSEIAKGISEIANSATGGDNVKPGWSQKALGPVVAPEGIEHLVGFFAGGAGQLAMQTKNIAKNSAEGKPQDVNKLPIVNRFAFDEPKSYTSRRYRELQTDFEYAKDYQKAGGDEKIAPKVLQALPEYEAAERELRVLFKELREAGASGADREPIQEQIKQAQARVIKAFNQAADK